MITYREIHIINITKQFLATKQPNKALQQFMICLPCINKRTIQILETKKSAVDSFLTRSRHHVVVGEEAMRGEPALKAGDGTPRHQHERREHSPPALSRPPVVRARALHLNKCIG